MKTWARKEAAKYLESAAIFDQASPAAEENAE
jgi:hypothetical protein